MAFGFRTPHPIDHTKVGSSDSTNFPALLLLSDARYKSVGNGGHVQSASGFDLRAYSDTGPTTAYVYELVTYNATTGVAEMWIKVPTLSHTVDTVVQVFYGDATITTDGSSSSTWDASSIGVWHLKDGTTLNVNDSTSNGNTATNNGGTAGTGKIDGGLALSGSPNYAGVASLSPSINGQAAVSMSGWFNTASAAGAPCPLYAPKASNLQAVGFVLLSSTSLRYDINSAGTAVTVSNVLSAWHHLYLTYDGTTKIGYLDGVQVQSTATTGAISSTLNEFNIGRFCTANAGADFLTGTLDEVRLSYTGRSADWVTAEYNNQNAPSTFAVMGTEVSVGGTTFTSSLAGALASSAAIAKLAKLAKAGSSTPAGAVTKLGTLAKAGTATSAGALAKADAKSAVGACGPAGAPRKATSKPASGGITSAGVLSRIKVVLLALSGAIAASGALRRACSKGLAGALTSSGAIAKRVSKFLAGVLNAIGVGTFIKSGAAVTDPFLYVVSWRQAGPLVTARDAQHVTTYRTAGEN